MSIISNEVKTNVPPPPPPLKKMKLFIEEDEDLHGGWGIFEVMDLDSFYGLGFTKEGVEIQGQKASQAYLILVEEMPHITLSQINLATKQGIIVQSKIEL